MTVALRMLPPKAQSSLVSVPFHTWELPDGSPWAEFHRCVDGYLVRFPGLADFLLSADGRHVRAAAVPGVSSATAEHLYLNQVLPLALGRAGKLVFHASAVAVPGGAVAFVAESGRGKSTLATAFAVAGGAFLTDDSLVLECDGGRYHVQPSHASVRLWHDSEQHLLPPAPERAPALAFTAKARLLAGPVLAHCAEPRRLLAAYVLGSGEADEVAIAPLPPAAALVQWTRHSFLLDVQDKSLLGGLFSRTAALAGAVPCYTLDFPRDYAFLDHVRQAVVAHASSENGA